jgi:hypothetical protein
MEQKLRKKQEGDRKQLDIFEINLYRRILGPVFDKEEEVWTMLKELMQLLNPPTVTHNMVTYIALVWKCRENRRK